MAIADETRVRELICEVGRRIWQKGYVASNDGNISQRISENEVICTPTGRSKGFLTPFELCKVDMEGNKIAGDLEPSSEILIHVAAYKARIDLCGCVHAHPPHATGFAVAGIALEQKLLPEVILSLDGIPLAPYETPSTQELAESFLPMIQESDAFLLQNHGAVAFGSDVMKAYYKMETIELAAQITLIARMLGGPKEIEPKQVGKLMDLREKFGLGRRHESCVACGACTTGWPKPQVPGARNGTVDLSQNGDGLESRRPWDESRAVSPAPAQAAARPKPDTEELVRKVTEAVLRELR